MEHHYFASSVAEWMVDTDLEKLVKRMKTGGFSFSVYKVPKPIEAHYKIRNYEPVVEGTEPIKQIIMK